jgi:phenylalanyl-tRNA synthetase beta chain
MGGKASGVSSNTKHVLLECALFDAVRVRKTSKFHGIHSDSSFRFERGVDPEMLELAQDRLIQLLQEICRAEVTGRSIHNPHPFTRNIVTFRPWKARLILGKEIADEVMQTILTSLDFEIQDLTSEGWNIAVPGCRVDVTREIDIIEEILRIYSFDEIAPSSKFTFSWKSGHSSHFKTQHAIIQNLVAQGCNEIQSLSLTKEGYPQSENRVPVQILNPLSSDLGVLRTSMIHGGLEAISFNIKRKQSQLRLFEIGKTYFKEGDQFKEESHLSVWMTGPIERENAHDKMKEISFREMRHCAEQLAQMAGIQLNTAEKIEHPFFVECIQYPFKKGAMRMGWISPELLKTHDIPQGVLYLELPLTPFIQLIQKHQPGSPILPKFPSVRRDLSMLIDRNVLFQDIEKTAYQSEKKWLKDVFLFDVYEGDKLPDGKKSYAVGFVLQDEQATMTDVQIDQCMQRILQKLNQQLGVELRG